MLAVAGAVLVPTPAHSCPSNRAVLLLALEPVEESQEPLQRSVQICQSIASLVVANTLSAFWKGKCGSSLRPKRKCKRDICGEWWVDHCCPQAVVEARKCCGAETRAVSSMVGCASPKWNWSWAALDLINIHSPWGATLGSFLPVNTSTFQWGGTSCLRMSCGLHEIKYQRELK